MRCCHDALPRPNLILGYWYKTDYGRPNRPTYTHRRYTISDAPPIERGRVKIGEHKAEVGTLGLLVRGV